jgi:hypothetical protein
VTTRCVQALCEDPNAARREAGTPLRRLAEPEDIAGMALMPLGRALGPF